MEKQTKGSNILHEDLLQIVKELVEPIDFDSLIEAGVLEEKGDWYKVIKITGLSNQARSKIRRIKIGSKGTFLKFRSPNKKLEKLLHREERSAADSSQEKNSDEEMPSAVTGEKKVAKQARRKKDTKA
jgi:predicted RNA-binding protein with PUA-like domain